MNPSRAFSQSGAALLALALPMFAAGCGVFPPPEEVPDAGAGDSCGGLIGAGCAVGEFCNYAPEAQCGAADQTGVCTVIPDACTREWAPVCGCDDKTYGNACLAAANGVSVAYDGECQTEPPPPTGETCGGIAGLACDEGEFCNYEPAAGGQGCDGTISDAAGVCQTRPEACIDEYDPVCGCDGRTHSNECYAHMAGVSVAYEGECRREGLSCDPRQVRCRRAAPECPDMQVPEVVDGCWGECVPVESCACDEPEDCGNTDSYTCHMYRGMCGPYVN